MPDKALTSAKEEIEASPIAMGVLYALRVAFYFSGFIAFAKYIGHT